MQEATSLSAHFLRLLRVSRHLPVPRLTNCLYSLIQPLKYSILSQGVRERAQAPQLVMLCRRWAHLQCFAGRTGRTHGTTAGYCVAGKRAQYRNIRPFKKKGIKYLCLLPNSLGHWPSAQQTITQTGMEHFPFYYPATLIPSAQWTLPAEESQI